MTPTMEFNATRVHSFLSSPASLGAFATPLQRLCAQPHNSFHHGQANHNGHTHPVQNASRRASTSTHSARMSFTSTRPKLHQICFPCHGTSSAPSIMPPLLRHRQNIHKRCTHTISGSSNACALLVVVAIVLQIFASQIHRWGEVWSSDVPCTNGCNGF